MSELFFTREAKNAKRGFTLVELLVVIGIIALLISILLPSLNKARRAAMEVVCMANLRTMGQALTMYGNEWKYLPGARSNRGLPSSYAVWPSRLRLYMKGGQAAFRCPIQRPEFDWKVNDTSGTVANDADTGFGYKKGETLLLESGNFSYGYNDWGAWDIHDGSNNASVLIPILAANPNRHPGLGADLNDTTDPKARPLKVASIRNATNLIVIADCIPDGQFDFALDPRNPKEAPGTVHRGGANVLHADGHVDWHIQKDLILFDALSTTNSAWVPNGAPLYAKKWAEISPQWNSDNLP